MLPTARNSLPLTDFKPQLVTITHSEVLCTVVRFCCILMQLQCVNMFQMKVLSVRSSPLREAQAVCTYSSINVCVVTVVDAVDENSFMEKNRLLGSSGILFVLQCDVTSTVEVSRIL